MKSNSIDGKASEDSVAAAQIAKLQAMITAKEAEIAKSKENSKAMMTKTKEKLQELSAQLKSKDAELASSKEAAAGLQQSFWQRQREQSEGKGHLSAHAA